jgi:hypothetical protein
MPDGDYEVRVPGLAPWDWPPLTTAEVLAGNARRDRHEHDARCAMRTAEQMFAAFLAAPPEGGQPLEYRPAGSMTFREAERAGWGWNAAGEFFRAAEGGQP